MEGVLDHVGEGVLVVGTDWCVTRANAAAARLLARDESTLVGVDLRETFPASVDSTFERRFGGADASPAAVTFEDYFPDIERWLAVRTAPAEDGLVVALRDVTDRRELEAELADSEAELDRITRINAIIQEIIRELIGATTREEVEETVCERLATSDFYEFTWVGERDAMSGRVVDRAAAGDADAILDSVVVDPTDASETPESAVLHSGETRVVRQLVADETVPESVRRLAFARGLQSAIAVPIRYGTTTYGVLGVYASRPDAFSDRERESLETLGVATGFVINAARQRNLLLSDTVVEITFRVTDAAEFFVAASADLDCTLSVEGVVPVDEETLLCYVVVSESDPAAVVAMAERRDGIAGCRVVQETAADEPTSGGLVEVAVTGASSLLALTDLGASVRTAVFEEGVGRIVAEISPGEDVREVVETVGAAFPGSELLAKRERERSVETAQEFRSSLHARLTDRQRTALRVAYHGGYFRSPRDSTAEELAAGIGISSSTLHYHLRAAQRKLADAFLDGNDPGRRAETAAAWPDTAEADDG